MAEAQLKEQETQQLEVKKQKKQIKQTQNAQQQLSTKPNKCTK